MNRIDHIRKLQENWNDNGDKAIPPEVCDNAEKLVRIFEGSKLLRVFPVAEEAIQLEFENGDTYFEIEVFKDHYTTFFQIKDGEEWKVIPTGE